MPNWNQARVANGGKGKIIIGSAVRLCITKQWPQLTLSALNGIKGMCTVYYGKRTHFSSIYLFLIDHFYHILTILLK